MQDELATAAYSTSSRALDMYVCDVDIATAKLTSAVASRALYYAIKQNGRLTVSLQQIVIVKALD